MLTFVTMKGGWQMSSDLPDDVVIRVQELGKTYNHLGPNGQNKSLRDEIMHMLTLSHWRKAHLHSCFVALSSITFDVHRGERLAILGPNGAGKSTLLKILCRITLPSSGTVAMRGLVTSILEVGTGFHPELSGRENVYLNGAILGLSREEINARYADIVEFSGVGAFIDEPLKHYSSGMYVRLAFSIAAHLDPDILIVDEVLAVGDLEFRTKCLERMNAFTLDAKRTIVMVSHDLDAVRSVATRCLLVHGSQLVFDGPTQEAIHRYQDLAQAMPSGRQP
jgi:lipopolysaccharide transport system ATP-binding protein